MQKFARYFQNRDGEKFFQTWEDHTSGVAENAASRCFVPSLKETVKVAAVLHDTGKLGKKFQTYLQKCAEGENPVKNDHSSAGGRLLKEMLENIDESDFFAEIAGYAIMYHHGVRDALDKEDYRYFYEKRLKNAEERGDFADFEDEKAYFLSVFDEKTLENCLKNAVSEVNSLQKTIKTTFNSAFSKDKDEFRRNRFFCYGMLCRAVLSSLIDADWSDAAGFANKCENADSKDFNNEAFEIFEHGLKNMESKFASVQKNGINVARTEISDICAKEGKSEGSLFALSVPTGSGKTISSMRFAAEHALAFGKRRIFYIAPYRSILDQNAEVMSEIFGKENVLVHHGDVTFFNDKENEKYRMLTENWNSPVVCTTTVQFLNTLFLKRSSSVRRFSALAGSVVIVDEAQALPLRIVGLFDYAVNFLTTLMNCTVVLCTATPPTFQKLVKYKLLPVKDIVKKDFSEFFKRTVIVRPQTDGSRLIDFSIEDFADLIVTKRREYGSMLAVVNTKKCARNLYRAVKELCGEEVDVYHLSTNMCSAHRIEIIGKIKEGLAAKRPLICVSTQLIEAGVDISFGAAARSFAGLDSVIQTAGRCNRNGEAGEGKTGEVFLVKLSDEAENVAPIKDIKRARDAALRVLFLKENGEPIDLNERNAMDYYYQILLKDNEDVMAYKSSNSEEELVDLLSANSGRVSVYNKRFDDGTRMDKSVIQAFETAGKEFEAIEDDGKINVIAEYDDTACELIYELENAFALPVQKTLLKKLQPYTVGISERDVKRLPLRYCCDENVGILPSLYYNRETGVSEDASPEIKMF